MIKRCGVCGTHIPEGVDVCPNDGVDSGSFESLFVLIKSNDGKYIFRVLDFPFLGTRTWGKSHFRSIKTTDGNAAYQFMLVDKPMFTIDKNSSGDIYLSSDITPHDNVNHWRIDGLPIGNPGLLLGEKQRKLELWSGNRHIVVMSLLIKLEWYN